MPKVKIIASASTIGGKNQKRGKLFEQLMADVLRFHGYKIDRVPNVNYAGMEIDVEGTHIVTGHPLCAECKCYESEIDSPKFQAFFGKFMTRWLKEKRIHGLFIAIPGLNSHASGFYKENCASSTELTVRLCDEDAVIDALIGSSKIVPLVSFANAVPKSLGTAGELCILISELGISIVQWVIPTGGIIPSHIILFDSKASPIRDHESVKHLIELEPELGSYLVSENGRPVPFTQLAKHLSLSTQSTYNVVHEMRILGFAKMTNEEVSLLVPLVPEKDLLRAFTQHLGEKLKRNRLVQHLLETLDDRAEIKLTEVSDILRNKCPYISAGLNTWKTYAEIFCDWVEAGGLAIFDARNQRLIKLVPGQDIAVRSFAPGRRRGGVQVLQVHFTPVKILAETIAQYVRTRQFDWPPMKKSTVEKALTTLESFGFISQPSGSIRVEKKLLLFLEDGADHSKILGDAALTLRSFQVFLEILGSRPSSKVRLLHLGQELRSKMGADWSDGTAQTTAKILLDWARHTKLAPTQFSARLRRQKSTPTDPSQITLL